MKKNILQISIRSDMGGGPQHIFNLISKIKDINFYIAAPKNGIFFDKFLEFSQDGFEIPYRRFSLVSTVKLFFYIKKYKIDLIHSHGNGAGIYSRILGFVTQTPVIHTHHGFFLSKRFLIKYLRLILEYFLIKFTSRMIFVSNSECIEYKKFFKILPFQYEIIPNGVFIPKKKFYTKSNSVLITVTRLEVEKGNHYLLLLFSLLLQKKKNLKLKIVGDGPLLSQLKSYAAMLRIENHVEFLGSRTDVPLLLENSDIYVSCSLGEAQGIAVLEAMSYGLPVVVSDVRGHNDTVSSGNNGFLFSLNNMDDGVNILCKIISNKHLADFLSHNARNNIIENFSINKMINLTRSLYFNIQ